MITETNDRITSNAVQIENCYKVMNRPTHSGINGISSLYQAFAAKVIGKKVFFVSSKEANTA